MNNLKCRCPTLGTAQLLNGHGACFRSAIGTVHRDRHFVDLEPAAGDFSLITCDSEGKPQRIGVDTRELSDAEKDGFDASTAACTALLEGAIDDAQRDGELMHVEKLHRFDFHVALEIGR